MKKIIISLFFVLFAAAGIVAAPVPVVETVFTADQLESVDLEQAIIKGCHKLNWSIVESKDNTVTAKYAVRSHEVTVDIPYNAGGYKIVYKDSVNMDYEPGQEQKGVKKYTHSADSGRYVIVNVKTEASIHKNYAKWVDNLNKNIKTAVTEMRWEK
jgi:hypothetical protein